MDITNRIQKTIAISSIWLSATTLFMAFNPLSLGLWQNAALLLVSGIVALGSIASLWVNEYCWATDY